MRLPMQLIFRSLGLVLTGSLLVSCSLVPEKPTGPQAPPQAVFFSSFESVWRAAQLTMKYPIRVNNMESGTLETEWVAGSDGFHPPSEDKPAAAGLRYRISMMFVKGAVDGRPSVKVTVVKRVEKVKDFFSEPQVLQSDGLEERVLLYRIRRELRIEEGIKQSVKKENKAG